MGTYRLTDDAKDDLIRIDQRGLREHGEVQADACFNAFFERFELLADQPLAYPAVEDIRVGYRRRVCGAIMPIMGGSIRAIIDKLQRSRVVSCLYPSRINDLGTKLTSSQPTSRQAYSD
jgi:toxin ParE1/3/4